LWSIQDSASGKTNTVTVPADGIISVSKPDSVQVWGYVNDNAVSVHHIHVKAGDAVHFKLMGTADTPTSVDFNYAGTSSEIVVPAGQLTLKENNMNASDGINLFTQPSSNMGGALGGGLGAGLVGGLLGTMLFRNGGLNGDAGVPATLPAVESVVNNAAINTALGDIKAAIPYNEAQVQLALAGAQADINGNITAANQNITNNLNTQSLANAANFAAQNTNLGNALSNITSTVNSTAAGTLAAVNAASILAERNAWAVTQAITNDGDKTRSLIQSIDKSNDSRTITNLANEISDLKNSSRLAEATGNITISNNNTATAAQQQSQAQQQQQLQYQILNQLAVLNADVQSVKQSSVVFNSGRMTDSGNQSAANTRVA